MIPIMSGKLMPPEPNSRPRSELSAGALPAACAKASVTNIPLPFGEVPGVSRSRARERVAARELLEKPGTERREAARDDRGAGTADERDHVVHRVHRRQPHAEQLAGDEQMAEIGAGVPAAGRAVAVGVERALVLRVGRVADDEPAAGD